MRFEWDEKKNRLNRKKHKISFATACAVFADPLCLTLADQTATTEERFWTIGRLENLVVVVVVHAVHDEDGEEITRIISARKATPRERRFYEEVDK